MGMEVGIRWVRHSSVPIFWHKPTAELHVFFSPIHPALTDNCRKLLMASRVSTCCSSTHVSRDGARSPSSRLKTGRDGLGGLTCCSSANHSPLEEHPLAGQGKRLRGCAFFPSEVLANLQALAAPCVLTETKSAKHVPFVTYSVWSGGLGACPSIKGGRKLKTVIFQIVCHATAIELFRNALLVLVTLSRMSSISRPLCGFRFPAWS